METEIITNATPKMTFTQALSNVFNILKGYGSYNGRARRSEFWYTTLICVVMSVIIDCLDYLVEQKCGYSDNRRILFDLVSAYFLIVNYSCLCRRMHDIGRSSLLPGIMLASCIAAFACLLFGENAVATTLCAVLSVISAALLVYCLFLCTKDSEKRMNKYGYSKKYGTEE